MDTITKTVYVVFTDRLNYDLGDYDQACMSMAEAKREVKDFKRMGYDEAFVKVASSEEALEAWHEARRGCKRMAWPKA